MHNKSVYQKSQSFINKIDLFEMTFMSSTSGNILL